MQVFTVNITRVVWPRVMNILDFRYFCQHNPLFYHLNLIPCHCWSWRRNIYFLVNTFVRHTFPMLKSSITESSELLAFKRQKDGYKNKAIYLVQCCTHFSFPIYSSHPSKTLKIFYTQKAWKKDTMETNLI